MGPALEEAEARSVVMAERNLMAACGGAITILVQALMELVNPCA